jgi:GT2 family glycosyltransferase
MKYWAHDEIRKVGVLRGCFWMVRREALDKIGLLDEDFFFYGEDIDWCKRFQKAGWDVAFYPGAEAIHIGAASSSNAPTRFYIEMQKADLQYWRKYHGRIGEFSYRIVILIRHGIRVIVGAVLYLFPGSRKKQVLFKLRRSVACVRWCLHI